MVGGKIDILAAAEFLGILSSLSSVLSSTPPYPDHPPLIPLTMTSLHPTIGGLTVQRISGWPACPMLPLQSHLIPFRQSDKVPPGGYQDASQIPIDESSMPSGPFFTFSVNRKAPNDVKTTVRSNMNPSVLQNAIHNAYRKHWHLEANSLPALIENSRDSASYCVVRFACALILKYEALHQALANSQHGQQLSECLGCVADFIKVAENEIKSAILYPREIPTAGQTYLYNEEKAFTKELLAYHPILMEQCIEANNKVLDKAYKRDEYLGYQADRQVEYDGCQEILNYIADKWIELRGAHLLNHGAPPTVRKAYTFDEFMDANQAYARMDNELVAAWHYFSGKMEEISRMKRERLARKIAKRKARMDAFAAEEQGRLVEKQRRKSKSATRKCYRGTRKTASRSSSETVG